MKKAVSTIFYINVIVFGITYLLSAKGLYLNNLLSLFPVKSVYFHPYQLITHIFSHENIGHIFSNMLFLIIFGPPVEKYFGTKKFWKFYILAGLFSSGLYCIGINSPILGASGAIFGIIGAYIFTNNKDSINLILFKFRIWIFLSILILYEFYLCFSSNTDGIGHWAHVFGAIFGILFFHFNKNVDKVEVK